MDLFDELRVVFDVFILKGNRYDKKTKVNAFIMSITSKYIAICINSSAMP